MKKPIKSTFDEHMESLTDEERKEFDYELRKLALSEMVYAAMAKDEQAVRQPDKMAGVSPTLIKDLKAGEKNFDLGNLFKVLDSLGFTVELKREGETIPLEISQFFRPPTS